MAAFVRVSEGTVPPGGGDGPLVVCVGGVEESGHDWTAFVLRLGARHRVAVVEWGTQGRAVSPELAAEPALPPLVRALGEVAAAAGEHGVHLVGWDAGGMAAQHAALRSSAGVRTLTLIGTRPAPLLEQPDVPIAPARDAESMALGRGPQPFSVGVQPSTRAMALSARLGEIRQPTLVLVGERDAWTFQAGAEVLHGWIPQSRLIRVTDAGHAPHRECAAATSAHVLAFLDEIDRAL